MGPQPDNSPQGEGWTIARAERLLNTLAGVLSARVVARPGGEVEEIHLLTTTEVEPKQTVRNVESALLAQFDLTIDHRKISVAQTTADAGSSAEDAESPVSALMLHRLSPEHGDKPRLLFVGHQVSSERDHRVRTSVNLEWGGETFTGESVGADLPRARLEALAQATLEAIKNAVGTGGEPREHDGLALALALDGVKVVEAFDRDYVLVGVHGQDPRQRASLTGAAAVSQKNIDRSVILATLQATDRWIRGRISKGRHL